MFLLLASCSQLCSSVFTTSKLNKNADVRFVSHFHRISTKTKNILCFAAAKKTKKQVYVSYSLPVTDGNVGLLVEDRIKKELELHPEHF